MPAPLRLFSVLLFMARGGTRATADDGGGVKRLRQIAIKMKGDDRNTAEFLLHKSS